MYTLKFSNDDFKVLQWRIRPVWFFTLPRGEYRLNPNPRPRPTHPLIQGAIYIKDDAATKTNCALLWNANHVYWRSSRYVTYFQTFQSSITTSYNQDVEYESLRPKLFVDFLLK